MIQILNTNGLTHIYLPDSRYPTLGNDGHEFEFDTNQINNLYKALGEKIADMELENAMDNGLQVEDLVKH